MAQQEIRDGIIWIIEEEGEWPLGPEPEQTEVVETIEDKLVRLEGQNLILMDALASMYEELLLLTTPV